MARWRWSRKFDACRECGTTDIKHQGHGFCGSCYDGWYMSDLNRKAKVERRRKRRYYANHDEVLQRKRDDREQRHFSGLREAVLQRDGQCCTKCSAADNLVVHHVDGVGRGSVSPNNVMDNLVTLCRGCHASIHHAGRWARHFDSCISCKRTDRRHNARGLCWACYRADIRMSV